MILSFSLLHLPFCQVFPVLKQMLSQLSNDERLQPFLLSLINTHLERDVSPLSCVIHSSTLAVYLASFHNTSLNCSPGGHQWSVNC